MLKKAAMIGKKWNLFRCDRRVLSKHPGRSALIRAGLSGETCTSEVLRQLYPAEIKIHGMIDPHLEPHVLGTPVWFALKSTWLRTPRGNELIQTITGELVEYFWVSLVISWGCSCGQVLL